MVAFPRRGSDYTSPHLPLCEVQHGDDTATVSTHWGIVGGSGGGAGCGQQSGLSSESAPAPADAALITPPTTRKGDMLYRPLGSTGEQVSAIGLGGHHIGRPADENEAIGLIRSAIDRGITFMDNS